MSDTAIEVLRKASHQQLQPLIEFLDRPLDMAVKTKDIYRNARYDLTTIPNFIEDHIRLAGGHTLANWVRGLEGPSYREVVADVCKSQKVKVAVDDDAAAMEFKLISELFERRWAEMTESERGQFIKAFNAQNGFEVKLAAGMSFAALAVALGPALFAVATLDFAIGLGWALAAGAIGEAAIGALAGPAGVIAAGLVLVHHALGPSRSATVPCVLHIASLRLKQKLDDALGEQL